MPDLFLTSSVFVKQMVHQKIQQANRMLFLEVRGISGKKAQDR
ncbi:hypothetical protein NHE_0044 [Neorickettsia helminthoeca str. Oregon]|uniref:Uncharacterized protein n=1 Tax=Neorickettsia helminthoeca str. Oregon TaxID=1286528 RepID=X5HJ01_9RICK|nr:hypothetical protein [Neorickettsia helminthoeca]AHX11019.1 hypothetical protein NHE_0044 [Neorickettsia helminthoeca str. Oregon]